MKFTGRQSCGLTLEPKLDEAYKATAMPYGVLRLRQWCCPYERHYPKDSDGYKDQRCSTVKFTGRQSCGLTLEPKLDEAYKATAMPYGVLRLRQWCCPYERHYPKDRFLVLRANDALR